MSRSIRLALVGLGNVGQSFLDLMDAKAALLADSHGIELVLTGVADSSAAALAPAGLNTRALRAHKSAGKPLHTFPDSTQGMSAPEMVAEVEADVLLEASAVNLKTGQPGSGLRPHRHPPRDGRRAGEQRAAGACLRRA